MEEVTIKISSIEVLVLVTVLEVAKKYPLINEKFYEDLRVKIAEQTSNQLSPEQVNEAYREIEVWDMLKLINPDHKIN